MLFFNKLFSLQFCRLHCETPERWAMSSTICSNFTTLSKKYDVQKCLQRENKISKTDAVGLRSGCLVPGGSVWERRSLLVQEQMLCTSCQPFNVNRFLTMADVRTEGAGPAIRVPA